MKPIVIALAEGSKISNYENWLKAEPGVKTIRLSHQLDNLKDLEQCHGIMLTGGSDIHPGLYNRPDYMYYVDSKEVDEKRDEFEWEILQHMEEFQKPLLGICRGLQMVNVFLGGTLIPDIPSFGKFNHAKIKEGRDRSHLVKVDPESELSKILGTCEGLVNSAHHQAVDKPGFDLQVNALSPDGVVEGMERRDAAGKGYLILVQWHPERMDDQDSVFSKNIKNSFLEAARNYTIPKVH